MVRTKFDIKLSTIVSIIATSLLLLYYLHGLNSVPQTVLLPVAGQVLSVGIHSLSTIVFSSLTHYAIQKPVPLDAIMPFLIQIDTQLGGTLTPERIFLAPLVTLLMLHTPETLLGTLAADKNDVRSVGTRKEKVELGPFGGAFDNRTYYLSGQLLLSTTDPDEAYTQVAYKSSVGWVITRKPIPWYEVFNRKLQRDNDAEKRITVPVNDAAILAPVKSLPRNCNAENISDFGFNLSLHHCGSYVGFSLCGNLPSSQGFYRLYRGNVSARYASRHGERFVEGSTPKNMVPVEFPRVESLWSSMANCFLNAISFNHPPSKMSLSDRLALSSIVRIAGLDGFTGFSTPPAMADAEVTDVVNTNISRFVVITMVLAVVIDVVRVILSKFKFEILSPELEPLVASFRDVQDLSGVGRYAREKRKWFHRVWGSFEKNEQGGGKWHIEGGMNGATAGKDQDGEGSRKSFASSAGSYDKRTSSSSDEQSAEDIARGNANIIQV